MRRQFGFNLIELMIGLTISLMGLAAVASMMMNFAKTRGTMAQAQTAQDNGVMALYRLEKDLGQAGYGLWNLQDCPSIINGNGTAPAFSPIPVIINDGGVGVSDDIYVQSVEPRPGSSGIPGTELSPPTVGGNTVTANVFNVRSGLGFAVDDRVVSNAHITASPPNCTLVTVTAVSASVPSGGKMTATISYADPALPISQTAGFLANFGNKGNGAAGNFVSRWYAVNSTSLTLAEYPLYTTSNLVDGIVFMKAQYGMSASVSSPTVARWVSGATAITSANVQLVKAIRIGVVARSTKREDSAIDQPTQLRLFDEKDDAAGLTDELLYTVPDMNARYRAYSTIVPLKNALWN